MARVNRIRRKKRSSFPFFLIILLLLAGAGGYIFLTYFEGEKPLIAGPELPEFIGKNTDLSLTISDAKSGLRTVKAVIIQNGKEKDIFIKNYQNRKKDGTGGTAKETIKLTIV